MAALSTNASQPKKRGGNRNPTGKGGFRDNPQHRSNNGQRKREVVQTAAQMRDLLVELLAQPYEQKPDTNELTNLQLIGWQLVSNARKGDISFIRELMDRIWGKSLQPISGPDGGPQEIKTVFDHDQVTSSIAGRPTGDSDSE